MKRFLSLLILLLLLWAPAAFGQSSHASTGTINADCEGNLTAGNFAVGFQCWDSTENVLYIQESGSWVSQSSSGDDLGDHTATTNLDLADFDILQIDNMTFTEAAATFDFNTIVVGDRVYIDAATTTTINNGPSGFDEGFYMYASNESTDGLQVVYDPENAGDIWLRPVVSSTPGSWVNILDDSELNSESELEALLVGVTNVLTDNDLPLDTSDSIDLAATSPIVLTDDTLSHANSGVTAETYTGITVDVRGHITAAVNAIPKLSGSQATCSAGNDDFEGWYYDTDESPVALCACVDGTRIVISGPNCDA